MLDHLSSMAQTLILLSTAEFNMVRLSDRHCTGSSIMPQKRNPCSLEVMKAKASFATGILVSLLSVGKALFMGYNRETQWTKYWIMDLVEESRPVLSVMREVIQLLEVHQDQMLDKTKQDFLGATSLMEWMVHSHGLPLRKAKTVVERAVKYSGKEGKVSYRSLARALGEMKIKISMTKDVVERVQKPEVILAQARSLGTPSEKRIKEHASSLQGRMKAHKDWALGRRGEMERAERWALKMEKELMR
jgi:argininosuccinate lyase